MLSRFMAPIVLAITMSAPLAYAGEEGHADFWRQAHVTISADGKVAALEFVDWKANKDLVGEKLEPLIRSWVFEPGRVDGKPTQTETTVTLHLDMRKINDDKYAITLLSAQTGVSWEAMSTPSYPTSQLGSSIEANIMLLAYYGTDGKIMKISVEQALTNGSKRDLQAFVAAIDKEVKSSWRFRPEAVGGHGMAGIVRVPVDFCIDGSSSRCRLMSQQMNQRLAEHGETASSNLPVALNSQTKLLTQVAGTTL